MAIYEVDPTMMAAGAQIEFQMMDSNTLPACLDGSTDGWVYPPPMTLQTADGGAFRVLEGEEIKLEHIKQLIGRDGNKHRVSLVQCFLDVLVCGRWRLRKQQPFAKRACVL